jgi:hypothetical protein
MGRGKEKVELEEGVPDSALVEELRARRGDGGVVRWGRRRDGFLLLEGGFAVRFGEWWGGREIDALMKAGPGDRLEEAEEMSGEVDKVGEIRTRGRRGVRWGGSCLLLLRWGELERRGTVGCEGRISRGMFRGVAGGGCFGRIVGGGRRREGFLPTGRRNAWDGSQDARCSFDERPAEAGDVASPSTSSVLRSVRRRRRLARERRRVLLFGPEFGGESRVGVCYCWWGWWRGESAGAEVDEEVGRLVGLLGKERLAIADHVLLCLWRPSNNEDNDQGGIRKNGW